MICFVGSAASVTRDLHYTLDLTTKTINAIGSPLMEINNHTLRTTCVDDCREVGTFMSRLSHAQLWWLFVLTEHLVMLGRVFIIIMAPTLPEWVVDARETL